MHIFTLKRYMMKLTAVTAASLLLSGCPFNEDDEVSSSYRVTIYNLTNNQPLSPAAVITHRSTINYFSIGDAASPELEMVAEGGDNSELIALALASGDKASSGTGPIAPGSSEAILIEANPFFFGRLTVASMLVRTNDGFAGLSDFDFSTLSVGETSTAYLRAYDAGTEKNTEASGTTPESGGGYSATRDDLSDQITGHPGVVSASDGLSTSILDDSHRFDSPVAKVMIERIR